MVTFAKEMIQLIVDELERREGEFGEYSLHQRLVEVAQTLEIRYGSLSSGDQNRLRREVGALLSDRRASRLREALPPELRVPSSRKTQVRRPSARKPPLTPERIEEIDKRHSEFWSPTKDD